MNKSYRETCKQEQITQKSLANKWGYDLPSFMPDAKQNKQKQSQDLVVANITLRKFSKQIQKTDKIKQVQDEIRALQNQKMLRQIQQTQQKELNSQQKSQIIKLMQKIVDNYNEIVQHKHITNKQVFEGTRNQIKPTKKSEQQQIVQLINIKKKRLSGADLKQQVKINRELAQLYRDYKEPGRNRFKDMNKQKSLMNRSILQQPTVTQKMNKMNSESLKAQDFNSLFQAMKKPSVIVNSTQNISAEIMAKKQSALQLLVPSNDFMTKSKDIQQSKRGTHYRRYSSVISKGQSKKASQQNINNNNHSIKSKQPLNDIEKDLAEPYIQRKQIEAYKQLLYKIKNENQAVYVWRTRVEQVCNKSVLSKSSRNKSKRKQLEKIKEDSELIIRSNEIGSVLDKQLKMESYDENKSDKRHPLYRSEVLRKTKDNEDQKQRIFASILKKRHSKFNKLWGTKILVKYNSQQQAKMMLKGEAQKNPSKNTNRGESSERKRSLSQRQTSKNVSRKNLGQSLTERNYMNNSPKEYEYDWRQQQKDQQHYWRMCKNQKINLLFKRK